ncbi:hypothetical protein OS189_08335 [Sulfitobacter sp. F26169L]|uniref:hypothetical protein n=1 Tax=Sulfitobacter sp. F26169L TaxID=2996015 RepID=UPI0022609DFC|nr:hypothetical protein [Sulfitobacter sp. F26169L]MCX7566349.1 hypothetical protein [Sulfitobacter sp. F26169L]
MREGSDDYGYRLNFHNMDTVKSAANRFCKYAAGGKACTLYAVTYSKGLNPKAKSIKGFSRPATNDLQDRYKRRQKPGKYGAFAINRAHGYGMSFDWKAAKEAREVALAYCKADTANALAPRGIEAVNGFSSGWAGQVYPCGHPHAELN